MELNFYTPREKAYLNGQIQAGKANINIEPLKEIVARKFPDENWDRIYFVAKAVGNALVELSKMNTCHREGWEWFVPKTPSAIRIDGFEHRIYTVAHNKAASDLLKVIWDRPRREVIMAIEVLKEAGYEGLVSVDLEEEDDKSEYLTLQWHGTRIPSTRNMIYLYKGSQGRPN
ncbi:hypothetical protein HOV30_gp132 [Erwinia phage Derbicus]|uniref:Uncharacterized protein n=2 Tax=Derbicusvirus derbicus TaxID=2734104 RepID=A0A482IFN5_9CAUD|nr:hypothetical protein BIZ82_gp132 [Erwinia phage vB_EamM_EarlPhillipIV]YP_009821176.1 hypothetical protein HOV30_gp132 [Erwinia phage Derbicus]ANZ48981.1 hypothetical protein EARLPHILLIPIV_132 [Erwinia phage vB_EamM_EarlPhillipIV]QBP07558.1 hypothetical protein DERBICUS_132 [Erwinia phage Derbicus]